LKDLFYVHSRIYENRSSSEGIEELIEKVKNMWLVYGCITSR